MPSIDDLIQHTGGEGSAEEKLQEKMSALNLQSKELETQGLAQELGLPYIQLSSIPIGADVLRIIPEEEAKEAQTLCFFHLQGKIKLATPTPDNPAIKSVIANLQADYPEEKISLYLTSAYSFQKAFKLYKSVAKIKKIERDIKIKAEDLKKFQTELSSFGELNQALAKSSLTDIFTLIIAGAIQFKSSDIHIEAEELDIKVRYRIDGVLQEVASLPPNLWPRVISRIKNMAKLKINVNDIPQDGRITIKMPDEEIDIRVSTLPSAFGESVVMRLLKSSSVGLQFEELGIRPEVFKRLEEQINRPNGMIITTGPTGSGKTTTLYGILNTLNSPENKIITLEDPVEYKIKGITQSQIDHTKGYTFSKGLRAILRQDPDIVLVGEIRDLETADTAIQAALTGHLMLSTVHTNDAAGAVPRLLSMGVKPFLLAPALNAIIGQRLVRRICPDCKIETSIPHEEMLKIKKILEKIPSNSGVEVDLEKLKFYKGQGCAKCNKLGYKGRIGVYEIFIVDKDIETVILSQEISEYTMRDVAVSKGMLTMAQDGLLKASEGITTIEEVFRVTEQK